MATDPVKVLLIDPQKIVLAGLRLLIETHARLTVTGVATNRAEALEQISQQAPDVIVLDLDLGEDHGLYLIPILLSRCKAKVLVLTGMKDLALHDQAIFQGARGVVTKDDPPKDLFAAIEKICRGELWLDRNATSRILLEVARVNAPRESGIERQKLASLTKKEETVLQAVVGSSDKQLKLIADDLCISQHTLRNHLAAIYEKLGVASRLELYVFYKAHSAATTGNQLVMT